MIAGAKNNAAVTSILLSNPNDASGDVYKIVATAATEIIAANVMTKHTTDRR